MNTCTHIISCFFASYRQACPPRGLPHLSLCPRCHLLILACPPRGLPRITHLLILGARVEGDARVLAVDLPVPLLQPTSHRKGHHSRNSSEIVAMCESATTGTQQPRGTAHLLPRGAHINWLHHSLFLRQFEDLRSELKSRKEKMSVDKV